MELEKLRLGKAEGCDNVFVGSSGILRTARLFCLDQIWENRELKTNIYEDILSHGIVIIKRHWIPTSSSSYFLP